MLISKTLVIPREYPERPTRVKRKFFGSNDGEREGIAMAIARQWLPTIKSRAQVKRKRKSLAQIRAELDYAGKFGRRGKVRYRRHTRENPLDFATTEVSRQLAEASMVDNLRKLFGPILEPTVRFVSRRGRRPYDASGIDENAI